MTNHAARGAQLYFMLISGAIFSVAYAVHSDYSGTMSNPVALGSFDAFWPYSSRFLTAWLAYKLLGAKLINTIGFRILLTFVCWVATWLMLPAFGERLGIARERPYLFVSFILIMLAHYCVTNVFFPYFVYDMPAIVYYLIVFLLLTGTTRTSIVAGCLLALVFEMNREPIAVALFHALGWWLGKHRELPERYSLRAWFAWGRETLRPLWAGDCVPFVVKSVVITLFAMLVLREVLMYIFEGTIIVADRVHFLEDGKLRAMVNYKRLFTSPGFVQQILATGFGLVFFLPVVFGRVSRPVRGMIVVSAIPLTILAFCNFFSELRIYDEYVPLMAVLLAAMLAMTGEPQTARDG
ncbi:MAG TPA: hypothetical protein VMB84_04265 [Stellaceae bacterium]|nr:hypothetical protein [Stellaceae bacterium]